MAIIKPFIMPTQKTRRGSPAVNAGSMADIAFLLLIFFLVTTTIQEDQGVLVRLPQWDDNPIDQPINDDNVLTVLVNADDELMVEHNRTTVGAIPGMLRKHVISPNRKPTQAVVSLTHDRGTSYRRYLAVYDALKAGYSSLWDDLSNQKYGTAYDLLNRTQQRAIRKEIPLVISEAEPQEHGELGD